MWEVIEEEKAVGKVIVESKYLRLDDLSSIEYFILHL